MKRTYQQMDNQQLIDFLKSGGVLVDIRRAEEWRLTGVVQGSLLLTFFAAESLRNNPKGIATFYQGLRILSERNRRAIEHMLDHGRLAG